MGILQYTGRFVGSWFDKLVLSEVEGRRSEVYLLCRPALVLQLAVLAGLILAGCATPITPTAGPAPTVIPTAVPDSTTPATNTPTAAPVATVTPTTTPLPAPNPAPARPTQQVHTSFPPAPDRDLYRLAAQLSLPPGAPEIPRLVNPLPVSYTAGRKDTFWLADLGLQQMYQQSFELRLVSPHAYWYVEEGLTVPQEDLERAAASFEAETYPKVTAAFGAEWSPGIDNDIHLNIINARLRGAGGYVISGDEHPQAAFRYSNQREAVYINAAAFPVGSTGYLPTVAHELQHLVHWNGDPTEETWLNEGLAELASTLSGSRRLTFARSSPQVSLVHWPVNQGGVGSHYEAASLFAHYLWEHYTRDNTDLDRLVQQPANGVAGVEAYLKAQGYSQDFRQVFQGWVVANFLDEPEGVYGYRSQQVQPRGVKSISGYNKLRSEVPQYAAQYVEVKDVSGPLRLRFQGSTTTPLIPEEVGEAGCWWSNAGDTISSTLTRAVNLTGLPEATLAYQVWHQVEENWDYGYVQVSTNEGQTWTSLATPHTSESNPLGNSYGPGYTGDSQGWLDERISLRAYAGQRILLRFHYVTDDGVNATGLCFRQISVPEAGLTPSGGGWQAEGFVLTGNRVAQDYIVQVIHTGAPNRVTVMSLDAAKAGELVVASPEAPSQLVVVVAALAPKTRQPAPYALTVEPAG